MRAIFHHNFNQLTAATLKTPHKVKVILKSQISENSADASLMT
jgi:hypothetical protein